MAHRSLLWLRGCSGCGTGLVAPGHVGFLVPRPGTEPVASVVSDSFATPWTVARQAPLSTGFFKQEYWSGQPCPPPEDLPGPGIKPGSPALQADPLPLELPGKPGIEPESPALESRFLTTGTTGDIPTSKTESHAVMWKRGACRDHISTSLPAPDGMSQKHIFISGHLICTISAGQNRFAILVYHAFFAQGMQSQKLMETKALQPQRPRAPLVQHPCSTAGAGACWFSKC